MLRQLADSLVAVLLAPPCASCGQPLSNPTDGIVCAACWRAARTLAPPFSIPHVSVAEAAGVYDGALREIVHAFKYGRRTSLARPLASFLLERCGHVLAGADAVVPVPLHPSRERQRGFNQADLLARALPLPCANILVRTRATPSQTDLPADERRVNVRKAFGVRGLSVKGGQGRRGQSHFSRLLYKKSVTVPLLLTVPLLPVLVDDVATTGATLSECARVLKEAGAREVRAVTIARAL